MNALLARYRELAELHGKHTVAGDAKKTNRTFDELHIVLVAMVVEEADILLFSLYEDPILWNLMKTERRESLKSYWTLISPS